MGRNRTAGISVPVPRRDTAAKDSDTVLVGGDYEWG
jgi:hypothetical protein